MSAIIESFYLSVLLFWVVVSIVSLGILLMPCFLNRRNKQRKMVFYLLALNVFALIGFFFGLFEYFFKSLGDFNLFFIFFLLVLVSLLVFIVVKMHDFINIYHFSLLIFFLVLIMIITVMEILYNKTFLALTSIALLCAVITFYMSIFSSLCRVYQKIMSPCIFSRKKNEFKLGGTI